MYLTTFPELDSDLSDIEIDEVLCFMCDERTE